MWTLVPVIALIAIISVALWMQQDRLKMRTEAARLTEEAQGLKTEIQGLFDKLGNSATEISKLKSAIETARQDAEGRVRAQTDNLTRQIGDMRGQLAASEKKANDLADRLAITEGKLRLAELGRAHAELAAAEDLRMAREVERRRSMQVVEHERDMAKEKEAFGRRIEQANAAQLAAAAAAKRLAEEKAALEREIAAAKASNTDTSQLAMQKAAIERRIEEVKETTGDAAGLAREQTTLQKKLVAAGTGQDVDVGERDGRIKVTVASRILFESGSDKLRKEGTGVLQTLAQSAAGDDREIHVVGHTDDRLIRTKYQDRYPTNWDLASARATAAARYLIEHCKISSSRIVIHSHGSTRPISSNETEEGRAKNRRIEIIFVPAGATKSPQPADLANQMRK